MRKNYHHQRGVALFVVIVIVMLSMLLALWASRTSLFNELLVGNDADYQRTFEAAQSMLQDAELDIREQSANGEDCKPISGKNDICRSGIEIRFVEEEKDLVNLLNAVDDQKTCNDGTFCTKCLEGICRKRVEKQDFWNDPAALTAMLKDGIGARYGTYTNATKDDYINPILSKTSAGEGAWYWIEVMPYDTNPSSLLSNSSATKKWELSLKPAVVYRITALARGLKPETQVVLQSTFARQKIKD